MLGWGRSNRVNGAIVWPHVLVEKSALSQLAHPSDWCFHSVGQEKNYFFPADFSDSAAECGSVFESRNPEKFLSLETGYWVIFSLSCCILKLHLAIQLLLSEFQHWYFFTYEPLWDGYFLSDSPLNELNVSGEEWQGWEFCWNVYKPPPYPHHHVCFTPKCVGNYLLSWCSHTGSKKSLKSIQ